MNGVTETCPECQFDPNAELDFAERFSTFAKRFPIPLTRLLANDPPDLLRTRPDDTTWSALEYAGHVAGICVTTDGWIRSTLTEDTPALAAIDPDEEVRLGRFNDVAPDEMAERVRAAAAAAGATLAALEPGALDRTATYAGMTFPLRLLVVAMVHEGHHHLLDIGRVLRTVRSRNPR